MQANVEAVAPGTRLGHCPACGSRLPAAAVATIAPPGLADERLTPRERTVLDLVAEGLTDGRIARLMGISTRTVHKHLEHVYDKLGVHGRVAVAVEWVRRGATPGEGESAW